MLYAPSWSGTAVYRIWRRSCFTIANRTLNTIRRHFPTLDPRTYERTLPTTSLNRLSAGTGETRTKPAQNFVDFLNISARSGAGGKPLEGSLRSQAFRGPGYGGHGGSVYLTACTSVDSLAHIPGDPRAPSGGDALSGSRGLHAPDLCLRVPLGTIVRERVLTNLLDESGGRIRKAKFLFQFMKQGDSYILAAGGLGGIAPSSFKRRDGRHSETGQRRNYELELRCMADCALIGSGNAGKTSLLASLTRALSRIGPEDGSTVRPHSGLLQFRDGMQISLVDLPGFRSAGPLVECDDKHILRHIWRTRLLIFVVDMSTSGDHLAEIKRLRNQIRDFDPHSFSERKWLVVGTKCDLLHRDTLFHLDSLQIQIRAELDPEAQVVGISARFGLGIRQLVKAIRKSIRPDDFSIASYSARAEPASFDIQKVSNIGENHSFPRVSEV